MFCHGNDALPQPCTTPHVGEWCPAGSSSDNPSVCPEGMFCSGGSSPAFPCTVPEGFYCPSGWDGTKIETRRSESTFPWESGMECDPGHYCAGGSAPRLPCTAAEGYYCPGNFVPMASSWEEGLAGRRCPPAMHCAGRTSAPEEIPARCDLVHACGNITGPGKTCSARQSTFWSYNKPPASFAVDADDHTCMKTADAKRDQHAQWVRIDLQRQLLVGSVRFVSQGQPEAEDFEVVVSAADAAAVEDESGNLQLNPSFGGALPVIRQTCPVTAAGDDIFEANCDSGTMGTIGRFVFILRARPFEILEVCDVKVFQHICLGATQELSCGLGYEPSGCVDEDFCRGCVPCAPGTYSDKEGSYPCSPCPGTTAYGERPHSPPGSSSAFQCEGTAFLEGTSSLQVVSAAFDQSIDSWEISIALTVSQNTLLNGLAGLFMPVGGDRSPANDATFTASNFPCRVAGSRSTGSDNSGHLEETACCLQDFRANYATTRTFREFTDTLDLVAANDICDSETGSDMLRNADQDVVGSEGAVFVDSGGNGFANDIRVDPVDMDGETMMVRITIPDVELYKVSRSWQSGNLKDSREVFIGLLELLPTGTRVVDSSSQQVSIVLTRTTYGAYATFGEQNIDYDFISFLNARAHKVESSDASALSTAIFFAEVSFVHDGGLSPVDSGLPVAVSTVSVTNGVDVDDNVCGALPEGFLPLATQSCGPNTLPWIYSACPQLFIPESNFGRIHIPLPPPSAGTDSLLIEFDLLMVDGEGREASLTVNLVLATGTDYVTWCADDSSSVDLAKRVSPSLLIGSEAGSPPRLFSPVGQEFTVLPESAETLQDGLVTVVLEVDNTDGGGNNLEVFFEDVLVVHVNPGSETDASTILSNPSTYLPTIVYDADTRDARMVIPQQLAEDCPAKNQSSSFFGCVHKHIVADKTVVDTEAAYLLESDQPGGAQEFMATMLGSGTAADSARALGRAYEDYLIEAPHELTITNPRKAGMWINPGHKWGGSSAYSLSQTLIVYVLFGVKSGVDGSRRSILTVASGASAGGRLAAIGYEVEAASLMESVLEDAIALPVQASMSLAPEDACLPTSRLKMVLKGHLEAVLATHTSDLRSVHVVSARVENADCDSEGETRRVAQGSGAVVEVDAVVVLADTPSAFLDIKGAVASDSQLLSMTQKEQMPAQRQPSNPPQPDSTSKPDSTSNPGPTGSSNITRHVVTALIGTVAGAALLGGVSWILRLRRRTGEGSATVAMTPRPSGPNCGGARIDQDRIESMLFANGAETVMVDAQAMLVDPEGQIHDDVKIEHLMSNPSGPRRTIQLSLHRRRSSAAVDYRDSVSGNLETAIDLYM